MFSLEYNLGSKWNATTDKGWDPRRTFGKTPKREIRTSSIQIRTWNSHLGSQSNGRCNRGSIQNFICCTDCKHLKIHNNTTANVGLFVNCIFIEHFFRLSFSIQNYDTSESKLRREFEVYGPIKKIIVVHNLDTGKPRGYAFIEYEHERDMHCKYWKLEIKKRY